MRPKTIKLRIIEVNTEYVGVLSQRLKASPTATLNAMIQLLKSKGATDEEIKQYLP
ncbi:hypothetical protein [Vibrio coralliilyticus]|uniref:hypothetical protein n=1 Tax=Vibrio coralliilyticus TaxID=190893 RepID=UPI00148CA24A|nr:hypothetical protein [Vibrio coralliilyticus]